jgi:hypothetical protein
MYNNTIYILLNKLRSTFQASTTVIILKVKKEFLLIQARAMTILPLLACAEDNL